MNIFGLTIARTSSLQKELQAVNTSRGWFPMVREPFSGAWQRNMEESVDSVLAYGPVFACQTLIASDIAKMRCRLVELDANAIWREVAGDSPFKPVLRKPNAYQNRIQFFENWMLSKLSWGNAYVLKARDARGVVAALYLLDPQRVRPLVSDTGEVFYELRQDVLARQTDSDTVVVPAREIIHDRFNCLFHPLVGLSPLFAATLSASQGLKIQRNSALFWQNAARPSGVLTAPGDIGKETAERLKTYWETNFSGNNTAKIAVLGDGLKYEAMTMTSVDAQLVEQLGISGKQVCAVYHVPPYKAGVTDPPSYNNIEALDQAYYSQCLQVHIEQIELCLDEGLGLDKVTGKTLGTEFDLSGLMRMDTATQVKTEGEAVKAGIKSPDEARLALNLPPVPGGKSPYLQQQNYSLEALAKRDAQEDPFGGPKPPTEPPANDDDDEPEPDEPKEAAFLGEFTRHLTEALNAA